MLQSDVKNQAWMTGLLTNPTSRTPCRTFPLSVHVQRCFIRSVMPLQPTDGALQEDTTVYGTLPSKWRPTVYDQSRLVIIARKGSNFSGIQRITLEAILGRPIYCVDKVGGKCANCLLVSFILRWEFVCTCHQLKSMISFIMFRQLLFSFINLFILIMQSSSCCFSNVIRFRMH